MEDKEFVGLVAHRFGLSIGQKVARKEAMKAVREHPNTKKIADIKKDIVAIEGQLLRRDDSADIRKALREQRFSLLEEAGDLVDERSKGTEAVRDVVKNYTTVINYVDNGRIVPELEKRGMLKAEGLSEKELVQAESWKAKVKQEKDKGKR